MVKTMKKINGWGWLSAFILLFLLLPIGIIISSVFSPVSENWQHIVDYMLKNYIINSTKLVVFSTLFSVSIGLYLAWIISAYDFPLRDFFKFIFILPLAIPPYIGAYTYNGMLSYTGIIQSFLRNSYNISVDQKYFDIMNLHGAVIIFTLFLFPYVYLITKSFLEKQSATMIESARMLGKGSFEIFFKVIIPIARVAIIGGGSLVSLEVLNDFGVVKYFGIQTFSVSIFTTWFGMGDSNSALRLSMIMMGFVFAVLLIEKIFRGRKKYHYSSTKIKPLKRVELTGKNRVIAVAICSVVALFSFIIPVAVLMYWAFLSSENIDYAKQLVMVLNSFSVTTIASVLVLVSALIVANFNRFASGKKALVYSKITSLGYSIPGSVIAMGIITLFMAIDRKIIDLAGYLGINFTEVVFSGSLTMLVFAYLIRFISIGYNSIESGFEKIGKKFHEASRTMGHSMTDTFFRVDLPMIKPAAVSAFLLVFIDIQKELPLTLILRPFNYNTLATKAFEYASDEMVHEAAVSSLLIIALCTGAIVLLNTVNRRKK